MIAEAGALARRAGGPAVALTFDPHPLSLLRPGQPLQLLTAPIDRAAFLQQLGADEVLTLRATPSLLHLTAAEFFEQVLRQRLAVRAMVEGPNSGLVTDREGNIALLVNLCRQAEIELSVVPPLILEGSEASSSRIRARLSPGDVDGGGPVARPATIACVAWWASAERRGRTIGFPTANLQPCATVVPGDGVYAVRGRGEGHRPALARRGEHRSRIRPSPSRNTKSRST